jgi:hypothetical protein
MFETLPNSRSERKQAATPPAQPSGWRLSLFDRINGRKMAKLRPMGAAPIYIYTALTDAAASERRSGE